MSTGISTNLAQNLDRTNLQAQINPITILRTFQQLEKLTQPPVAIYQSRQLIEANNAKLNQAAKRIDAILSKNPDTGIKVSVYRKPGGAIASIYIDPTPIPAGIRLNKALDEIRAARTGTQLDSWENRNDSKDTVIIFNRTGRANYGFSPENEALLRYVGR